MNVHKKINVRSYFPYGMNRFFAPYTSKYSDMVTGPLYWFCTKKKQIYKFKF
jgi:hypothetical protein